MTTFRPVNLLRALSRLVLAFALLGVVIAPAQAIGSMTRGLVQAHGHDAHGGHGGSTPSVDHTVHDHGAPADEMPVHKPDACKTACCISVTSYPLPVSEATMMFYRSVRYREAAQAASGRVDAPEPGIPKLFA
ncbi:MAG TPA: hypothetical protein VIL65_09635 [Beijerinckiaceae bacterium]